MPASNEILASPKAVSVPHGEKADIETVSLILLEVLLVTKPEMPTPLPRLTVVELVLILRPTSDWALTGNGIKTTAKQVVAKMALIKLVLISLSTSSLKVQRVAGRMDQVFGQSRPFKCESSTNLRSVFLVKRQDVDPPRVKMI